MCLQRVIGPYTKTTLWWGQELHERTKNAQLASIGSMALALRQRNSHTLTFHHKYPIKNISTWQWSTTTLVKKKKTMQASSILCLWEHPLKEKQFHNLPVLESMPDHTGAPLQNSRLSCCRNTEANVAYKLQLLQNTPPCKQHKAI